MANRIINSTGCSGEDLKLSNGAMSVLISSLCISGSRLAEKDYEIDLVTWLASRDQSIIGRGTVGFALTEMPWSEVACEFEEQKKFMLQLVEVVSNRTDLHVLDYDPPFIESHIGAFGVMVQEFNFGSVSIEEPVWYLSPHAALAKCELHGVILHEHGCVVCNDK